MSPSACSAVVRLRISSLLSVLLALWLGCIAALPASAQGPAFADTDDSLEVSLVTYGPGNAYWERFGHNSIVIRDRHSGQARAYNYGIFDFDEENFFVNFLRGEMRYRMAVHDADEEMAYYRREGRSVVSQQLDLAAAEKRELQQFLEWNALPENTWYQYDYFLANCSTKLRDALDQVLGGRMQEQTSGRSRGYTYRLDALRMMTARPALMLLIDIGLGPYADRRLDLWHEGFVPDMLARAVSDVQLGGGDNATPLVAHSNVIAAGTIRQPPALPPDLRWPFLILGIALATGLSWLHARRERRVPRAVLATGTTVLMLVSGLLGLLLAGLWAFTAHQAAWANENLFLFSPLALLLVPAWLRSARLHWQPSRFSIALAWLLVLLATFALFSKVLPWFKQANLHWILLMLPLQAVCALLLTRQHLQQRAA